MSVPEEFTVEVTVNKGEAAVIVTGDVDVHTTPRLWTALEPLLARRHGRVVVDVGAVPFIDSAGIRVLLRAVQVLPADVALVVRAPNRSLRLLLKLTGLGSLVTVEP